MSLCKFVDDLKKTTIVNEHSVQGVLSKQEQVNDSFDEVMGEWGYRQNRDKQQVKLVCQGVGSRQVLNEVLKVDRFF